MPRGRDGNLRHAQRFGGAGGRIMAGSGSGKVAAAWAMAHAQRSGAVC